ncbi:hypothetical protein ACQ86O_26650 [Serratia sp. L9]|uniref:hypothetical protein n=1 Tax=Serratia sp. L9 TaxID=3423946 RepID=UPI003D67862F
MTIQQDSQDNLARVLVALQVLSNTNCSGATVPPQAEWPTTRQIANFCDINIYDSRRYLMKLVKDKKAWVSSRQISNSLHWFIIGS